MHTYDKASIAEQCNTAYFSFVVTFQVMGGVVRLCGMPEGTNARGNSS